MSAERPFEYYKAELVALIAMCGVDDVREAMDRLGYKPFTKVPAHHRDAALEALLEDLCR